MTGWQQSYRRLYAGLAAALVVANPLLHKSVSDVADFVSARIGFPRYDVVMLVAIPVLSLMIVLPALARARETLARRRVALCIGALALMSAAAQHWLLVANIELVHLPQFALLAAVLSRAGLSAPGAFAMSTLAGIFDETYQHLVIYADTPGTYFDINDIVLNALGAAWGVLLAPVPTTHEADRSVARIFESLRHRVRWSIAAAGALALAWWWDPPVFTPLFRTSPAHPFYRVLSTVEGLVICGVLGALVLIASTRGSTSGRSLRAAAFATHTIPLMLALVVIGCAPRARVQLPQPVVAATQASSASSPFITTFWCGPPLPEFDDARAREIADAGFSIVGPPCEGPITPAGNRHALDVAATYGLKMWIADPRYNERARRQPEWEAALDAAVEEYRRHPAFGGYFVTDEPSFELFDDLRAIVSRLHAADPEHLAYINLNPDYVFGRTADTVYPTYVDRFVETVQPALLSFDYYPFLVDRDRPTFFRSLALIRDAALRKQIPFLLILLAMPHGPYRDPSEAEVSWQAFHGLAYGAGGISYFAYWTPVDVPYADVFKFHRGLIENGRPTAHYVEASRLNPQIRAIATQLIGAQHREVRDSRGEIAPSLPFGPVRAVEGGPATIGFFDDGRGGTLTLVVNRDYRQLSLLTVRPVSTGQRVEQFDSATDRWVRTRGTRFDVPAGGAILLRWHE